MHKKDLSVIPFQSGPRPAFLAGVAALLVTFGAGCGASTPTTTTMEPAPAKNQVETNTAMVPKETAMKPAPKTEENGTNTTTSVPAIAKPTETTKPPAKTTSPYKDGTYVAMGAYQVHAGPEEVEITVTLKDGLITATSFKGTPKLPMSKRYMEMFDQNYKPMVVGKKISDIQLTKVSGSSLTPVGFNNAIEKIKQQAAISS